MCSAILARVYREVIDGCGLKTLRSMTSSLRAKRESVGRWARLWRGLPTGVFEVEFCDQSSRTYASLALRSKQLLEVQHEPSHQAS